MIDANKSLTLSKLRVGIFVLFGLAVLGFLILNASGDFNPFATKLRLKAHFGGADGLRPGSEVQLAGVRIGKVEEVTLLPADKENRSLIEAVVAVDDELNGKPMTERIRTDSVAQLVAPSFLANDKVINITPGTLEGSPVQNGQTLNSGESVSISNLTETGNELLGKINELAVPVNDILTKANKGEGTLGRVINDERLYDNLDATVSETKLTLAKLQTTIEKINNGDGSAGKLLNDAQLYDNLNKTVLQLEAISSEIRAGRGTAGKLVNDEALYNDTRAAINEFRTSAVKINGIADDLKLITTDISEGKGTAGKLFKDDQLYDEARNTLAKFNQTATRLEMMLGDAQAGKGTLGRLVTDETLYLNLNQTASNINQLSSEGSKLIYDFRQNPKKYLRIKLSLF